MNPSKYNPSTEFLLYKTPNGDVKVDVLLQNETIWMPQKKIAELFDVKVPAVSKHLKNIFDSFELEENSVISILETTALDNKKYKTKFYNLDAIIAVGYRVNSNRATQLGRILQMERLEKLMYQSLKIIFLKKNLNL